MGADMLTPGQRRAVEALGGAHGDVYDVGSKGGWYYARRDDGTGEALEGDTPGELDAAIRADRAAGTEAAGAACRRPDTPEPPPDILGDLEFLEYHWGSAYLVAASGGGYTADRRDGKGTTLAAADRDGLARKISADYIADPVSRDLAQDLLRDLP